MAHVELLCPMIRPPVVVEVRTQAMMLNVLRFARAEGQTTKLPLLSVPTIFGEVRPVVSHQIRPEPAAPKVSAGATPVFGELVRTVPVFPLPDESATVVAPAASPNR